MTEPANIPDNLVLKTAQGVDVSAPDSLMLQRAISLLAQFVSIYEDVDMNEHQLADAIRRVVDQTKMFLGDHARARTPGVISDLEALRAGESYTPPPRGFGDDSD